MNPLDLITGNLWRAGAVGAGIAALVLGGLYYERGLRLDTVTQWQSSVLTSTREATDNPKLPVTGVPAAIAALHNSLASAQMALDNINQDTMDAKKRSDAERDALRAQMLELQQKQRASLDTIARLESRKPATSPAEAAAVIEQDSMSPWQGWTK